MTAPTDKPRLFLIVIDGTPEQDAAIRYAAHRAAVTASRVALLYVVEPQEISPWRTVEQTLSAGQEAAAQAALRQHQALVEQITGHAPVCYIRHGIRHEVLLTLLEQEHELGVLVLGAGNGSDGPGPLISFLTSAKGIKQLKIPLVVVPQGYEAEQLKN